MLRRICGREREEVKGLEKIGSLIILPLVKYYYVVQTQENEMRWHKFSLCGRE